MVQRATLSYTRRNRATQVERVCLQQLDLPFEKQQIRLQSCLLHNTSPGHTAAPSIARPTLHMCTTCHQEPPGPTLPTQHMNHGGHHQQVSTGAHHGSRCTPWFMARWQHVVCCPATDDHSLGGGGAASHAQPSGNWPVGPCAVLHSIRCMYCNAPICVSVCVQACMLVPGRKGTSNCRSQTRGRPVGQCSAYWCCCCMQQHGAPGGT
jgi:hypothetical protein